MIRWLCKHKRSKRVDNVLSIHDLREWRVKVPLPIVDNATSMTSKRSAVCRATNSQGDDTIVYYQYLSVMTSIRLASPNYVLPTYCLLCAATQHCVSVGNGTIQGGSFDQERWFFEKVLSGETGGPILRNRGPIRGSSVSPHKTADKSAVLFGETVFRRIGPRFFHRETSIFAHLEQHLNPMSGPYLIADSLLTTSGPRRVVTCTTSSCPVTV